MSRIVLVQIYVFIPETPWLMLRSTYIRAAVCIPYVDCTQAWFKHAEPHPMWGIFPRLAYELFKDKDDGWKVTMKYFQNVVDTVRWVISTIYCCVAFHTLLISSVCFGDDIVSFIHECG